MSSVVSVLFAKEVEGVVSLAGVGWSAVFSIVDCSLRLRELLCVSDCTTSCINPGISSQVNGVHWLPLALLGSLPLPRERVDMPRGGRCFALLVSVLPPRDRVVRPRVDRCFGILVLYREEKLFTCHSTRHLVGVPADNAHVLLSLLQRLCGSIVAEVVAVCAAPCIRCDQFNAFLLLFQMEESQGTFATTQCNSEGNHGVYWWKCHLLWMKIAIISW